MKPVKNMMVNSCTKVALQVCHHLIMRMLPWVTYL